MDWRIFHPINDWAARHTGAAHAVDVLMTLCVVGLVLGAILLWFAARPGTSPKWKLASAAGLASGALAFVFNQVIHAAYDRPRPFEAHTGVWHPYASGTDAAFPSDHASAAFGIAWAVFLVDRAVGAVFLAAATIVGVARVVDGAHVPSDVLVGALVGLGAALVVVRLGRPLLERLVRLVERLTDPLVRPLWRRA